MPPLMEEYLKTCKIKYNPRKLHCQKQGCKGKVNTKTMLCGTCFNEMTSEEIKKAMYIYKLKYFKKHPEISEKIRILELL